MNRYFERIWQALTDGISEKAVMDRYQASARELPVIWLLGKTGAGKSSLIRALTGLSAAEVGNGFEPCTRTSQVFDYPDEQPLMRFLDTRGLGEADYDPSEDLAACEKSSHVLLAVARLDDPVQEELAGALREVRKRRPAMPVIVVHNGADLLLDEQARFRARSRTQTALEKAAGSTLPYLDTALPGNEDEGPAEGLDELINLLDSTLPQVALLLTREDLRNAEREQFDQHRADVLRYASAAGASDVTPVLGAVTVPAIQAAMLRMLGKRYGVEWTRARLAEFAVALGTGVMLRYGSNYAVRQAAKLIPVFGQTAGAAAAGTISFATTFALGRTAALYLHKVQAGQTIGSAELRSIYKDALKRARHERK